MNNICPAFSSIITDENNGNFFYNNSNLILIILFLLIVMLTYFFINKKTSFCTNVCINSNQPWVTLIFSGLNIIWAVLASLKATELLTIIDTSYWNHHKEISLTGFIFILVIVIVISLTLIRDKGNKYLALSEKSLPPQSIIKHNSANIKENIYLLNQAKSAYDVLCQIKNTTNCDKQNFNARSEAVLNDIETKIKQVFSNITNISNEWSQSFCGDTKFTINYFSIESSSEFYDIEEYLTDRYKKEIREQAQYIKNSIECSPFFVYNDNYKSRLDSCDYLLICRKSLSTSNIIDSKHESDDSKCLILPYVSDKHKGDKSHFNFFGAPKSLESRLPQYIKSTSELIDNLNKDLPKYKHFNETKPQYQEGITKYYTSDNTKSILSIPLYRANLESLKLDDDVDKEPDFIGVLNIYSSREDVLQNQRYEVLYDFINPHIYTVSCLISLFYGVILMNNDED